jgi:hypothetical protein
MNNEKYLFSTDMILSDFTLALLQDSGWYTVNPGTSEKLVWGRGRGCEFVRGSCGEWKEKEGGCSAAK